MEIALVLRGLHAAHQAPTTQSVVLGDKTDPETYKIYNDGCVVDLAEEQMGKGGGDLCVEVKAWDSISKSALSAAKFGHTHAFANTEEKAIKEVLGVSEREGDARFAPTTGTGAIAAVKGDYHDAIHTKRTTVVLLLHNIFGGFAPWAVRHLKALAARKIDDRTEYESWAAADFPTYHAQRISAAIITGDARRCLNRIPGLQRDAMRAIGEAAARRHRHTAARGRA